MKHTMDKNHETKEITVLSWNIHDATDSIEGPKSEDKDFAEIIRRSTIFCLQETKQDFSFPDYRCFNSLRKDSRSGGLCIGVHRSLEDKIKPIELESPDLQAISLRLQTGPNEKDLSIINVYDSPEHGAYKKRKKITSEYIPTMENLMEFMATNKDLGEICLTGDFNARTSNENYETYHSIDDDEGTDWNKNDTSHPVISRRSSKDNVVNKRGKILLDALACTNLSILNGCTIGDVLGEFTYVNYNGKSVVDYIATSQNLKNLVNSFEILDLTKFSDHKPCICRLNVRGNYLPSQEILERLENVPTNYKWNNENQSMTLNFLLKQREPPITKKLSELT